MSRCHIYHRPTGTLLARDLYELQHHWLIDRYGPHERLPVGAFCVVRPEVRLLTTSKLGSLYLGGEALTSLPRGQWHGSENMNVMEGSRDVLAVDEVTPVALERLDCHTASSIEVDPNEWDLENVGNESGVCLVAWIHYQGSPQLLRAAYGRDESEAKKRLLPAAQTRLQEEAGAGSQPGMILNAPIEIQEAGEFASQMRLTPDRDRGEVRYLRRGW